MTEDEDDGFSPERLISRWTADNSHFLDSLIFFCRDMVLLYRGRGDHEKESAFRGVRQMLEYAAEVNGNACLADTERRRRELLEDRNDRVRQAYRSLEQHL
jgi:hypothetical protein